VGNLVDLMFCKNLDEVLSVISALPSQSQITHSHLILIDNKGNIAAAMNGLWTNLDASIDRRFPQNMDLSNNIPLYDFSSVVQLPPTDMNNKQGFPFLSFEFLKNFSFFDLDIRILCRMECAI
jgi:hypothetical protein